jgi:hypothetical protein
VARLLIKTGESEPSVRELNLGVNRFGRHPDCEFPIEHPTISAFHCEMVLTAEGVLLRDCDSTNGTFINDRPVKEAQVQAGETVRLGEVEVLIESTEVRISIPAIDRYVEPPPVMLPDGTIFCRRHPQAQARFRCAHCQELLCEACVHRVRRKGGRELILCGLCSHATQFLGREQQPKQSLLRLLSKTIKMPFMRRKRKR